MNRYEDAAAILRHPGIGVADIAAGVVRLGVRAARSYPSLSKLLRGFLFFCNPPFHTDARLFIKRTLGALADRLTPETVESVVKALVSEARERGQVEAMSAICSRLPVLVMANALGLSERSVAIVHASGEGLLAAAESGLPLRVLAGLEDQARQLDDIIREEIHSARRSEGSGLSRMLAINKAEFGFDDDEIIGFTFFLLIAGIETTSAFLGSSILLLLLHPSELRHLRNTPELMAPCLDEILRFASPVRRMNARIPSDAIRLGGVDIEPGMPIIADIEQAHHDPTVYEQPGRLDIGRRGPPSLAFGTGGRACLGATLARLEASMLVRALFSCEITLLDSLPDWEDNPRLRRLKTLNLLIRPEKPRSI